MRLFEDRAGLERNFGLQFVSADLRCSWGEVGDVTGLTPLHVIGFCGSYSVLAIGILQTPELIELGTIRDDAI